MNIDRDKFFNDGFLTKIQLFDKSRMKDIYDNYVDYINSNTRRTDLIEHKTKTHLIFSWANEIIFDENILNSVRPILGDDFLCWNSLIFHKKPQSNAFVSMHQDQNYWGIIHDKALSVQIAISDSTEENGCLKLLPGSHREKYKHVDFTQRDNLLARGQSVKSTNYSDSKLKNIELSSGEGCIFHGNILHGSLPNRSSKHRLLFTIRYLTPDNKVNTRFYYNHATLVSGTNSYNYFNLEPRFDKNNAIKLKKLHNNIIANQFKNYMTIKIKVSLIVNLIFFFLKRKFIRNIYYLLIGKV